jgi:hypothetical protein
MDKDIKDLKEWLKSIKLIKKQEQFKALYYKAEMEELGYENSNVININHI